MKARSAWERDDFQGNLAVRVHDVFSAPDGPTYMITGQLGKGAFGQVLKVTRTTDMAEFALKISKGSIAHSLAAKHEVSVLNKTKLLNCDRIVQFIESFESQGHVFIVFELLSYSIFDILRLRKFRKIPFNLIAIAVRDVAIALADLHRNGFIHTDVKPENILLESKTSAHVKLIDLGSVIEPPTTTDLYLQSRYYRAPEVVLQIGISAKSDVWSLGCVMAEMYLGLPVFPGQTIWHLLYLFEERLGPIPVSMIDSSPLKTLLFPDGTLITEETFCTHTKSQPSEFENYFLFSTLKDLIMKVTLPDEKIDENKQALFLDLLSKILVFDPAQRISLEMMLKHPFFAV